VTTDEARASDLGVTLAWCTEDVPARVETTYEESQDELNGALDDPDAGLPTLEDPDWDVAHAILAASDEFHDLRERIAGIQLAVVLRDMDEAELVPWPDAEAVETVVLRTPAEPFRELESRVTAYVETVVALAAEVEAALS
jgi:hypothetical protein